VAGAAFRSAADLAARRDGAGTRQLRRNLARVVPHATPEQLDALVRDGLRSYARYWREAFTLPSADHRELHDRIGSRMQAVEYLDEGMAKGRGVVAVLPHTGNWDMAGLWFAQHHGVFTTVVERLRPEALYRRFVDYRASLGFDIVPLTGAGSPTPRLVERLRAGGVVCLLADRDLTSSGVEVDFFGAPARMPGGPARLAAATGATLLVVGCWFTRDGWGIRFHEPIPVPGKAGVAAATQAMADRFATDIAAHPQDWHMLQPLWNADRTDPQPMSPVRDAG
jgi:lauroyl/myristoyl acyltransferase